MSIKNETVELRSLQPQEISLVSTLVKVMEGPDKDKQWRLRKRSNTIGTSSGCELVLSDRAVSRHHLLIKLESSGIYLEDLNSKNGTFVGKLKLQSGITQQSLTLRLGATTIRLELNVGGLAIKLEEKSYFGEVLGQSTAMRELFADLKKCAAHDVAVLLEGETGTGKELLAKAIHEHSPRKQKPFVTLDCSQLSTNIAERELFGHVKGAYTDAHSSENGYFDEADGGTLFIDEIGELPLELQVKFLRVLEYGEFKPLGSQVGKKVDIRFVYATNRNLAKEVNRGAFRNDLFHRISVVHLNIPPLRERHGDIPILIQAFVKQLSNRMGFKADDRDLQKYIQQQQTEFETKPWSGNVRELRNRVERMILEWMTSTSLDDRMVTSIDENSQLPVQSLCQREVNQEIRFREAKQSFITLFERTYLRLLLEKTEGNVSEAARLCQMDRRNLQKLLQKHGL